MPLASTPPGRPDRLDSAAALDDFLQDIALGHSERYAAAHAAIPRSTARDQRRRAQRIEAEPEVVAFLETPAGQMLLHRLVLAAHVVLTLLGPCGVAMVRRFLELSGLAPFVARSHGAQHHVAAALLAQVQAFADHERTRLSAAMVPQRITLVEDETFHPQILLVAMEAVSGFVVLESYAPSCDAACWNQNVIRALDGLRVEVIQVTSDEGKGLVAHVTHGLGAVHSPDLFHVQHELSKATAAPLAARERAAQRVVASGAHRTDEEQQACVEEQRQCVKRREQARAAIRDLGEAYHPFDPATGAARSAQHVQGALQAQVERIESLARDAGLTEASHLAIAKAGRVVPSMGQTMGFFVHEVGQRLVGLGMPTPMLREVAEKLVPALYLTEAAGKTSDTEKRALYEGTVARLLAPLREPTSALRALSEAGQEQVVAVAKACAQVFQRASSCVEGRNGQLSLRHHSLHTLSPEKLSALTTVHNYVLAREDGTTAAERFFGQKPLDLFEWLLDTMPLPPRPAPRRPRVAPPPLLN